jgi:hypothetical protein
MLDRMPVPAVNDEFSYLLAADTFAHGRLTNPTHPMWRHFEAPHIFHLPTYMSKYPPAQGLVMALGQAAVGLPIAGVWLSAGLACGALTWMLAGWMPGRWALAGGLLAVVHPLTIIWSQSYWGGLVAVTGGALALGAFRRIVRRPRARHAAVLGVGLAVLANSRPYEGLVFAVPLAAALGLWLARRSSLPGRVAWSRVLLPLGGVLAVAGGAMLYYNVRVTGEWLTTPYFVHERAYATTPPFIFQDARPATVGRPEQRWRSLEPHKPDRTLTGLAARVRERAEEQARVFFGSLLIIAGVGLLLPLERSGWHHLAILDLAVFTVGLGLITWLWSHYAAPGAGLALLVVLRALRRVGSWRPGGIALGRPLAQAVWLFMAGTLALGSWTLIREWGRADQPGDDRTSVLASLGRSDAKHLVIVRRGVETQPVSLWVFNGAEIDTAPVVWARELDAESNARLIDYFKDRRVWLLEAGRPELRPYPDRRPPGSPSGAPKPSGG